MPAQSLEPLPLLLLSAFDDDFVSGLLSDFDSDDDSPCLAPVLFVAPFFA
jgi:hypothetical protein